MQNHPSFGDEILTARLNSLLSKRCLRLRFEPNLEKQYELTTIKARSTSVRLIMGIGIILIGLGLVKDLHSFEALENDYVTERLFVLIPLHLLAIYTASGRFPAWAQGTSVILAIWSAITIMPLFGMASDPQRAEIYLLGAGAMGAIMNLVVPLRFWHAFVYSLLAIGTLAAMVFAGPAARRLTEAYGLMAFLAVAIVLSLGFAMRLEIGSRRAFLMNVRDRLRTRQLVDLNAQLKTLSDTDQLTGLPNRRNFDSAFDSFWSTAISTGDLLGLLLIDIDHFKNINDQYGHADGDICLRAMSDVLQETLATERTVGERGLIARYGGEEFVAILPGVGEEGCLHIGERLWSAVEKRRVLVAGGSAQIFVTVSIGVAVALPYPGLNPGKLFTAADEALYRAKASGRNTVMRGSEVCA